jgi:hypothetical protein
MSEATRALETRIEGLALAIACGYWGRAEEFLAGAQDALRLCQVELRDFELQLKEAAPKRRLRARGTSPGPSPVRRTDESKASKR